MSKAIVSSGGSEFWTAFGLVGAGVILGGVAGYATATAANRTSQGSMGAVLGGLAAATGGAALAVTTPSWREVGERMALVGLASFTSMALLTTLGIGSTSTTTVGAATPAPALPATAPVATMP